MYMKVMMFSANNGHFKLFSILFLFKPLPQIANWDYVSENLVLLCYKKAKLMGMRDVTDIESSRLEGKRWYTHIYFKAHEKKLKLSFNVSFTPQLYAFKSHYNNNNP